jgi:glutaredoxin
MAETGRFALVTRQDCHLCEVMARTLDEILPRYGLSWEAIDVDADPRLRARFAEVVPVLLRDGQPVAKVRVDASTLRRLVERKR